MTPRVFLCEPSGLSTAQRRASDHWHERLFGFGFDVDQLRSESYAPDPWPGLRERLTAAHGVLVLGFRQLFVTTATWRRDTDHESDVGGTWSSPWLHIEAGLAIATGLPLLLAPESGVREGVFAPETWTDPLRGTSMENPDAGIVTAWARAVTGRFSAVV
jgi:hypothetical protein